jgi:hypothetical protein
MTPTHKNGTCTPFSILKFHKNRSTEQRCSTRTTVLKDLNMKNHMSVFSRPFLSIGHLQAAVLDRSGHDILPF